MTASADKRTRLRTALENAPKGHLSYLQEAKEKGRQIALRDDALWFLLIQSFSTMGNSKGWEGVFGSGGRGAQLSYGRFVEVPIEDRAGYAAKVFAEAKVRMPSKKGLWLAAAADRVETLGGPSSAWKTALALGTRPEKLDFLRAFDGIGEKYARNIWMDTYDPNFRNAVAIDARIKRVTEALGLAFASYVDHESFYQQLAHEAGREPWEVDRLLYKYRDHYLAAVQEVPRALSTVTQCK